MNQEPQYWGMPVNTYCMLLHLSQLSSFLIPGLGLVLPVLMWALNKDKNEQIDQHGKVTLNWLISAVIYGFVCFILWWLLIGALAFVLLAILNVIFAVMAAIRANDGELWPYPLSIRFFKV